VLFPFGNIFLKPNLHEIEKDAFAAVYHVLLEKENG
jgi:hypothetical protein